MNKIPKFCSQNSMTNEYNTHIKPNSFKMFNYNIAKFLVSILLNLHGV